MSRLCYASASFALATLASSFFLVSGSLLLAVRGGLGVGALVGGQTPPISHLKNTVSSQTPVISHIQR